MRYFKFFIITLLVFSCSKKQKFKKEFNLEGSWSVVDRDSTYYEAFYNDSTYQYYFGDNDYLSSPAKYKIKADTLIAYRKEDNKEKATISFIEKKDDKLFVIEMGIRKVLYIPIDNSEYTINKIRNGKDFKKFHKAYLSRKYVLIRKGIIKKDGW
jgi:hypothetical protein